MFFFPFWLRALFSAFGSRGKRKKIMSKTPSSLRVKNPSLAHRRANIPGITGAVQFDADGTSEPIPADIARSLVEAGYELLPAGAKGDLPERDLELQGGEEEATVEVSAAEELRLLQAAYNSNLQTVQKERDDYWRNHLNTEEERYKVVAAKLAVYESMQVYVEHAGAHTPDGGKVRTVQVGEWRTIEDDDIILTQVVVKPREEDKPVLTEDAGTITITDLSEPTAPLEPVTPPVIPNLPQDETPADTDAAEEEKELADALNSLPVVGGAPSTEPADAPPPPPPPPPVTPEPAAPAPTSRRTRRANTSEGDNDNE